jgi:microsomal dipeptidase-like Zn-dependent dipeptidase
LLWPLSPIAAFQSNTTAGSATVESDRGLYTAALDTLNGRVVVNLPDDLSAGDTISGTVDTTPAGKSPEETAKNQDELNGVVIEVGETKTPSRDGLTKFKVPSNAPSTIPLIVRDKGGKEIARTTIPVKPSTGAGCQNNLQNGQKGAALAGADKNAAGSSGLKQPNTIQVGNKGEVPVSGGCDYQLPTNAQPGRPLEVRGPFDGDLKATKVLVAGKEVKVLAESPRKAVALSPSGVVGPADIEVLKHGVTVAKGSVRNIGVKLAAAKLNLMKGETTPLTVTVFGLEGLNEPVSLRLTNKSPNVVSLEGGDQQSAKIDPQAVKQGQYVMNRTLTGIQPGGFSITTVVDAHQKPATLASKPRQGGGTQTTYMSRNVSQQIPGGSQVPGTGGDGNGLPVAPPVDIPPAQRQVHFPPGPCDGTFDDFESGFFWQTDGNVFIPVIGNLNVADLNPAGLQPASGADSIATAVGGSYWNIPFRNGHQGEWWVWSGFAGYGYEGNAATGSMTSPEFLIQDSFVDFLVGGGDAHTTVALEIDAPPGTDFVGESSPVPSQTGLPGAPPSGGNLTVDLPAAAAAARRAAGAPGGSASPGAESHWRRFGSVAGDGIGTMRRVSLGPIPATLRGHRARFVVRDDSTTAAIEVDDFRCSNERHESPHPVWGIADLHSHPMSHLGFGYADAEHPGLFWGQPTGSMETALAACTYHANAVLGITIPDPLRGLLDLSQVLGEIQREPTLHHNIDGYPSFVGWPNFDTIIHQQMYIDWIRRAYQGGLRVMMADVVNNRVLSRVLMNHEELDDEAINRELAGIRDMVSANSSWMEIAYTPAQARSIVGRGKLAVVLGVEVDSLETLLRDQLVHTNQNMFDFLGRDIYRLDPSQASTFVPALVNALRQAGIRHVFPIHLSNNSFGGTAVYEPLFNIENLYLTDDFYQVADGGPFGVDMRVPDPPNRHQAGFQAEEPVRYNTSWSGLINRRGLTHPAGQMLVRELERQGMIIDVAHMSELATDEVLGLQPPFPLAGLHDPPFTGPGLVFTGCSDVSDPACLDAAYPVLESHTGIRDLNVPGKRKERELSRAQADRIYAIGGIIGLGIRPDDVPSSCQGSTRSWVPMFQEAESHAHGQGIGLGTDGNGFNGSTRPRMGWYACIDQSVHGDPDTASPVLYAPHGTAPTGTQLVQSTAGARSFNFNTDGWAHYGLMPDFLQDTINIGLSPLELESVFDSAEQFIEMWEKDCRIASHNLGGGDACR